LRDPERILRTTAGKEVIMLESVRQYFQDWSDACEYAKECAPDLTFLGNGEPYTALLFIGAVCYAVYAINEARIRRRALPLAATGELKSLVEQITRPDASPEKLAA
jgi:hypothetical protein